MKFTKQPERRNPTSSQWEFHWDVTRHGQLKHTGDTQEVPRQQKEYEKSQKQMKS
jgi:hypothetical protein